MSASSASSTVSSTASSAAPLLDIKNATKIYGGGFGGGRPVVALQDFSLTIADKPATITTRRSRESRGPRARGHTASP